MEPTSTRPVRFPSDYGQTGEPADLLPWTWAEERIRVAPNYWIISTTPAGRPHARPLDGVWVDGAPCFGGSPETQWVRNLQANPEVTIHLGSTTEVVIMEGRAEFISDMTDPLVEPSVRASHEKYPQYYTEEDTSVDSLPFWILRPRVVYAWTLASFPRDATRWSFQP